MFEIYEAIQFYKDKVKLHADFEEFRIDYIKCLKM